MRECINFHNELNIGNSAGVFRVRMQTDNVVSIRKREVPCAVECTVDLRFYDEKLSYTVTGIEMSLSDRFALAAALEATANDLRR